MRACDGLLVAVRSIVAGAFFAGSLCSSDGAHVGFEWTQNSDPDLAGYKLYYGPGPRNYTNHVVLGFVGAYTVSNLVDGATYYFALTAFNTNDVESSFSTELRYPNPPVLGGIADQTVAEDGTHTVSVLVTDVDTPLSAVTVSASSANQALVPDANISFAGSSSNRTMTIRPAANQTGSAIITVTANDGGLSASRPFTLTVTGMPDPPTISEIAAVVTDEDVQTAWITFTVTDFETASSNLTLWAASSNPALIPTNRITLLTGTGNYRNMRLRPTTNQSGSATITLTVSDGTLSSSTTFGFTVRAVNDLPTITQINDVTVPEDTQTAQLGFTIGDTETASAGLQVTASSSNPLIVPDTNIILNGGSGTNRTVRVRPLTNVVGSAVVTVTVSDGEGSASEPFTITYTAVNDAPVVSQPPDVTVNKFNPVPPVSFTVWDTETAASALSITLSSTNTTLLPLANMVLGGSGTNRTLTLTPSGLGSSRVGIHVSDGSVTSQVFFVFTHTGSNNAPLLTVPSGLAGRAGAAIAVTGLAVADPDVKNNNMNFTISAANGTLAVLTSVNGGVRANQVSGNNSGTVTITAPLAAFNLTFAEPNGLTYHSRSDFRGAEMLVVTASDNGFTGLGGIKTDTENIAIQITAADIMEQWRAGYFTSTDLQDPTKEATVWGDLADPDNDGRHNLMEFALGLNPLGSEPQEFAMVSHAVSSGGSQYQGLTFHARINEPALQYIPEVSADNATWSATAELITATPVNAEFQRVTYQDPVPITSEGARFIRLRVVKGAAVETLSETFVGSALTIAGVQGGSERTTLFSLRTVRPALYGGKIGSIAPTAITDPTANWTVIQFAGRAPLYAEFDSGLEADIQQIDYVSKTLFFSGDLPPSLTVGTAYRIREHHTVAEIFGLSNQAGLRSGANAAEAETIRHLIPETQQTRAYFYLNFAGFTGWVASDYSPASNVVVYPEQGLMVRRQTAGDVTLTSSGPLKPGVSRIPIFPGNNLLGLYNQAMPIRLDRLDLIAAGFTAGPNAQVGDIIRKINADGLTSSTYFYLNLTGFEGWYDISYQPAGHVTLSPGVAFILYRRPAAGSFEWSLPAQ